MVARRRALEDVVAGHVGDVGMTRAIIGHAVFDLDGTLVDSAPHVAGILNAMRADRGVPGRLARADVAPHVTAGGRTMVAALLGDVLGDPDRALEEFRQRYADAPTPPTSLYPSAREALTALTGAGVVAAIFSNKPQRLCEKVLDDLDLTNLFAAVIGTGSDIALKPDPAGLDLALARSGGGRDRCCYVGDSESDFELSRRAGVPLIMVRWGYGEPGRDWPGARVAEDFMAVPALVTGILAGRARG